MPDLPNALTGVPGNSEAAKSSGRFARMRSSLRLSFRPSFLTDARVGAGLLRRRAAAAAVRRTLRTLLSVAVASAVGFSIMPSFATADDLTARREQVQAQLARSQEALGESTQQLNNAAVAVESAQAELATAQATLAATQVELAQAKAKDVAMAAKLKVAQAKLAKAKAAVVAGQKRLDAEHAMAGAMVRDQYQQQTNLLPIAILVESRSTADLGTRLQWSTTMFDTTAAYIDRLTVIQKALAEQKARQAELEKQIAADRKEAAANLVTKKKLQQRAAAETASVARLVRQRAAAQASAARAVAADRREVTALDQERQRVEHRIAVRIAQAKAEAARKAAIAKAAQIRAAKAAAKERAHARAVAAKARKEAAAQEARVKSAEKSSRKATKKHRAATKKSSVTKTVVKKAKKKRSSKKAYSGGGSSSDSSRHHGFIYPSSGAITSPYGRRFHPILHVWKLHDGTDFHASCGSPIRAAYSGKVVERYYNSAYGNRLMIDHGNVDGRYVTTGYNHAQRYRVHVGDRVSKGEVIGYAGATGYATGCHLHLMVWLDGSRVNPMSWY
ncbi:MAG: M23 family metallopeptidase [Propionibacteriaceae bacterium]